MKTMSGYDANFVVLVEYEVVVMTTNGASNDNTVGIMKTQVFIDSIGMKHKGFEAGSWGEVGGLFSLTHWGRVTHKCVSRLAIIGSDNGLSPDWCQAIIWTNDGILLIGPLGTTFSEILIEIHTFSAKKMQLKCRLENGGHFASASMC